MFWIDIFDASKMTYKGVGSLRIEYVNEFLFSYTTYEFFAFNGIVFKVMNSEQWDYKKSKTDFLISKILLDDGRIVSGKQVYYRGIDE